MFKCSCWMQSRVTRKIICTCCVDLSWWVGDVNISSDQVQSSVEYQDIVIIKILLQQHVTRWEQNQPHPGHHQQHRPETPAHPWQVWCQQQGGGVWTSQWPLQHSSSEHWSRGHWWQDSWGDQWDYCEVLGEDMSSLLLQSTVSRSWWVWSGWIMVVR